MVIAGVVLAAIIGGILMFAFGKKNQDPRPPDVPTVSGPTDPGAGPSTPTGRPTTSGPPEHEDHRRRHSAGDRR